MKQGTIILLVIVGIFLLIGVNGCNSYNSMVTMDEVLPHNGNKWK